MEINDTSREFEKIANEFLRLVRKCIRHYYKPDVNGGNQKYDTRELKLMDEFFKMKSEVNAALCNAIDLKIIAEKFYQIIDLGKKYVNEMEKENKIPNCLLLRNIAVHAVSLSKILGTTSSNMDNIFAIESSEAIVCQNRSLNNCTYELIMPYVTALTIFRKTILDLAQQRNINDIIKECNRIQDEVLPKLGIVFNEANPEKSLLTLK